MAAPRIIEGSGSGLIRPDDGGGRILLPRAIGTGRGRGFRQRIPTLRELAALLVDGVLTLPDHYRRGMFLDMFV
ncbi:MAG: hypothetical protein P4M00_21555 [Azospirillaceae bacterium]|nr:hypothetical protein [Azospirillaceae bacterium]